MTYISNDGEECYPGELKITLLFTLHEDNSLTLEFEATTDKSTVLNLTQHGYFNLSGMHQNILKHELTLFADYYLPVKKKFDPDWGI